MCSYCKSQPRAVESQCQNCGAPVQRQEIRAWEYFVPAPYVLPQHPSIRVTCAFESFASGCLNGASSDAFDLPW